VPGIRLPAAGGSTTVGFFGHPANSTAATSSREIDANRFIDLLRP
jgi:hypothetical protein